MDAPRIFHTISISDANGDEKGDSKIISKTAYGKSLANCYA